ncbi:hypothetical protein BCR44DRAFT_1443897 [Catenaria anguillulae PL171]|uniref:Uncharacterized protein n=1 Tax=Catenaria anguillulae PL171 TaxID=765915 RepID=A0A1Y2HCN7_9FUNG|nr:hypothetical protein BCR44DRAFT_1447484 [Catenaria anguillulae PL171]ORZ30822.1 hypothetical protein BCR44DRAFT_1443897 [Catenaria anguillulae PL171]
MRSCIWRLWACLMVILTLVVGNIVMVFGNKRIAQIVYTTVGWISCHLISVALFAATRLIKTTVLTRRLVPQSVAGTLAQSEWGGRG